MADLPAYRDLPRIDKLNMAHAWDVFGQGDELGTINLLTADVVKSAMQSVRHGRVINLTLPLSLPDPPMFGRQQYQHTIFSSGRSNQDDYLSGFYLQSSSQWDGLRHVRAREFGFYGGHQEDEAGPEGSKLGISAWAEHGIIGRGVLLDVYAYLQQRGTELSPTVEYSIGHDLLEAVAEAEKVELRSGDILLLRTGWMRAYLSGSHDERAHLAEQRVWPGLAADEAMAAFLWDHHVAAVAADNPAVEVGPGDPAVGSLHRRIIPLMGLAVGELWNLEALSEAAQDAGRYECCVVSIPLNLPKGVGSPANALAVL